MFTNFSRRNDGYPCYTVHYGSNIKGLFQGGQGITFASPPWIKPSPLRIWFVFIRLITD